MAVVETRPWYFFCNMAEQLAGITPNREGLTEALSDKM